LDGSGANVGSVNLSTVTSAEALGEAIDQLPPLAKLTSLDASRTTINDAQLATIAKLESLTSLALNETAVTNEGVRQLERLKNLQVLYLASTPVTDGALGSIAAMNGLRILDLSATNVAGQLGPLAALPRLEWLVLRNLSLQAIALDKLADNANLKRLTLTGSRYDAGSLDKLRQARTDLSVDP
jgi:Leucine-rich repeat (LRR) protein